jgi:Cof subfamily protein (haloacid dehalogenase superfamily)
MSPRTGWLLALDVDRTLLTDDYRLLPPVRDAVQAARRDGVTVALATARGPVALEVILRDLGEIDHAICFGGALVLDRRDGVWQAGRGGSTALTVGREAGLALAPLCRTMGLSLAAYGAETAHVETLDDRLAREFSYTGDRYREGRLQDVDAPIFKYLVISDPDQSDKLTDLSARLGPELSWARSHLNYLEVGPAGVSKGRGLAVLAQSIGVEQRHTVAIGDGENDLPMLAWAGISIAMGNASQLVRDAATWTTGTNAEAGVATAIKKLTEEAWNPSAP